MASKVKLSFESVELLLASEGLPLVRFELFPIMIVVNERLNKLSSHHILHPVELEATRFQYVANIRVHLVSYNDTDKEAEYFKQTEFVKIIITATGLVERSG